LQLTVYDLYLESGPRRRKTMVHVLGLLGCVAVGPTTEDAIAATPEAIRAFLGFLLRHGEPVDASAAFDVQIVEHVTQGQWLGNGSPYLAFGPDFEPLSDGEVETFLRRFQWLRADLADWAAAQSEDQLNAGPAEGGRSGRAILHHVLGPTGAYLSAALGSAPGFGRIAGAAERGELSISDALLRSSVLAADRVRSTTSEERTRVRESAAGPRTLRKALRRMLEHDWEHLVELSRRPGGPSL
jgi:predicted RNase H-like HicB family nuclease/uncharacterized damage-inducible protein DinB